MKAIVLLLAFKVKAEAKRVAAELARNYLEKLLKAKKEGVGLQFIFQNRFPHSLQRYGLINSKVKALAIGLIR